MDVESFSELLKQVEGGESPEPMGEAADLLTLASGLIHPAPAAALSEEAEDRIFAKMQALEPSLQQVEAYDLDPALSMLASRLEDLGDASEEVSVDARLVSSYPVLTEVGSRAIPRFRPRT